MQDEINRENWTEYFKGFSKRNQGRSTMLEVFGDIGAQREEQSVSLRFHSQPGRAASKRGNDDARSPAVFENAPDSLLLMSCDYTTRHAAAIERKRIHRGKKDIRKS